MNLRKRRNHYHESPKAGIVYCDSSYEIKAALILDADPDVLFYETQIEFQGEKRTRYLDFLVHYQGYKKVVEVKPARRLCHFEEQIEDNRRHALSCGYQFCIWSEPELGFADEYSATKWADEYLSSIDKLDYVAIRKERSLEKSKKHYRKKVAVEKLTFFCEYCKQDHEQLKLTYDKNVAKNGRHICHKENADKPKPGAPKKINPYAAEGKKQCNRCQEVLEFSLFGVDKTKSDGYATRCLKCRAIIAMEKYNAKKQ